MNPSASDISKEILNEIEVDRAIAFAQDPIQFNAVKKYLLAVVYKHGVIEKGGEHKGNVNFALNLAWSSTQQGGMPRTDEELGQNLRALTYATQLVESGFNEIREMKKVEPTKEETKPAAETEKKPFWQSMKEIRKSRLTLIQKPKL